MRAIARCGHQVSECDSNSRDECNVRHGLLSCRAQQFADEVTE